MAGRLSVQSSCDRLGKPPWPIQIHQQNRFVLADIVVAWKYMMLLMLGDMMICDSVDLRPIPWPSFNMLYGLTVQWCFNLFMLPSAWWHFKCQFEVLVTDHSISNISCCVFVRGDLHTFLEQHCLAFRASTCHDQWVSVPLFYSELLVDYEFIATRIAIGASLHPSATVPSELYVLYSISLYRIYYRLVQPVWLWDWLFQLAFTTLFLLNGSTRVALLLTVGTPRWMANGFLLRERKMVDQLSVSFVLSCLLRQSIVPFLRCVCCQDCWKLRLEFLQSAVHVAELNSTEAAQWFQSYRVSIIIAYADFKLTCIWLRLHMFQVFPWQLQGIIIFFVHFIIDRRIGWLLGVGKFPDAEGQHLQLLCNFGSSHILSRELSNKNWNYVLKTIAHIKDKETGEKCPTTIHDVEEDQSYDEKSSHYFTLTTLLEGVDASSYYAFVIPGGLHLLLSVGKDAYALIQELIQRKCGGNCRCVLLDVTEHKFRVAKPIPKKSICSSLGIPVVPIFAIGLGASRNLRRGGMLATTHSWAFIWAWALTWIARRNYKRAGAPPAGQGIKQQPNNTIQTKVANNLRLHTAAVLTSAVIRVDAIQLPSSERN